MIRGSYGEGGTVCISDCYCVLIVEKVRCHGKLIELQEILLLFQGCTVVEQIFAAQGADH